MANIGYIGLGVMGGRMAARLIDKGHVVIGHNRTVAKAQWLIDRGLRWADSPRAVSAAADVTFVMVTDSRALRAVAEGPDGFLEGLTAGKVLVDMSTVSPTVSREIAARVAEREAAMVDAPVSGSVATLEQGKLSIMVGGEAAVVERIRPLLQDIGPKVTHMGANGTAVSMKIAINLSLAVQMAAFSETVLLAEKSGIDRQAAVTAALNSVIASPMLQYRGPFVLDMPDEAWFSMAMMKKDVELALELGRERGIPLPTTAVIGGVLDGAIAAGLAEKDFAALFTRLEQLSEGRA